MSIFFQQLSIFITNESILYSLNDLVFIFINGKFNFNNPILFLKIIIIACIHIISPLINFILNGINGILLWYSKNDFPQIREHTSNSFCILRSRSWRASNSIFVIFVKTDDSLSVISILILSPFNSYHCWFLFSVLYI